MDFAAFKSGVKEKFALDLDSYKETQLKRRLESFLSRHKTDYGTYYRKLLDNRADFKEFVDFLTINVSEFFRDAHLFGLVERDVLPRLLARRRTLRLWSAACANGAEPYSLAILLEELSPGWRHHLLATDIDQQILAVAGRGTYGPESLRNVSPARLARFFREGPEGTRTVADDIKKRVLFRQHDLLKDPFEREFDLIVCRNVLIYFTRQAQNDMFRKFSLSLVPSGFLFIGGSEMIFGYRELSLEKVSSCLYTRLGNRDI